MTLYSHQDVLQAILIQVSHQQMQETRHIIFIILNKQLLRMNTRLDTSVILLSTVTSSTHTQMRLYWHNCSYSTMATTGKYEHVLRKRRDQIAYDFQINK